MRCQDFVHRIEMVQTSAEAAQRLTSWTDDLPVCTASGLGSSTNELYRRDGRRTEMHPTEDRTFSLAVEDQKVCIYGVFDGFSGPAVADFASKKFPAELLLDQLTTSSDERTVRKVLSDTFDAVDREFFQSISEHITAKMVMLEDGRVPSDNPQLQSLEAVTMTGASATVAILLNETRLSIAYVGDTRAVVASMRQDGDIKALQLTVDHVIGSNQDEALRLSQLGLDIGSAILALGEHGYTRCLGHHKVKGGYKDASDLMKKVKDEPVLAYPDQQFLTVEPHHLFLLIYTRPLADCLARIMDTQDPQAVANELCALTFKQFSQNTTVSSVAQSTVDKIVLLHHEKFETAPTHGARGSASDALKREDVSLLIRNLHTNLSARKYRNSGTFSEENDLNTITTSDLPRNRVTRSSTTTEESSELQNDNDDDRRIEPYVDFDHFHNHWTQQPANVRQRVAHILNKTHENGDIR